MHRFFIHLISSDGEVRDRTGILYEAPELAYMKACRMIPDIAAAMLRARKDPMDCRFVIENGKGEEMFLVPFSDVIRQQAPHVWHH